MTQKKTRRDLRPGRLIAASIGTTAACAIVPPLITMLAIPTKAETTWADYKDAFDYGVTGSIFIALPLVSLLTLLLWPFIASVVNRFKPLTFWSIFAAGATVWIPWGICVASMVVRDNSGALNPAVVAAALGYTSVPFVSLSLFYYFYLRHVYGRPAGAGTASRNFQHSIQ